MQVFREPPRDTGSGSQQGLQNQRCLEEVHELLNQEKFDSAIQAITNIYGDHRLRKRTIRDYLIRLSTYLARLKPDLVLPSGWLRDESDEFAETVKTSVALLGNDFISSLIQLCAAPDFRLDRYLLHVFLEISLDGYLWTDMVDLCLSMAVKDQKSQTPSRYMMMSEKLCNVRQIISHSPNGHMPNPFFDGVAEDDVMKGFRQHEGEILFSPGNPIVTVVDIEREIAIALANAAICATGCDPAKLPAKSGDSLALRLFRKTMHLRFYRESVLLAKYCGVAETASVFTEFSNWVILVTRLQVDHWDNYFKEIAHFLERMDISPKEKIYQKGQESAETYVERTLEVIQGALVDLYLELGTTTDLKAIVSCYMQSSAFPRLDQIIVDPRNFSEILWHLLEFDGQSVNILRYISDWANGVSGRECIATKPVFSVLGDLEEKIELPYINANLYSAVKNYFAASVDSQIQSMWSAMDAELQNSNRDGKYFRPNGRLVVTYTEPTESSESASDQEMDSAEDQRSN